MRSGNGFGRRRAPILVSAVGLACLSAVVWVASSESVDASPARTRPQTGKTIGLALTSWQNGLVETPDAKQECTLGLQPGEIAQLKATPGAVERIKALGGTYEIRGPNGETGNFSPLVVEDPLPFSELRTKAGVGLNLDGTQDGRPTTKSCKHEKFTSAENEKIDNQMARVIGCILGYRKGGLKTDYYSQEVANFPVNRHLLEIIGVDNEMNDPSVEVAIYKGYDRLVRRGDDKYIPLISQRIDHRFPKYMLRTHGKIVNGVLITDPMPDALMPVMNMRSYGDRVMKNLVLRLKLNADGAEGLLAGYEDWRKWYNIHSKTPTSGSGRYSSPSIYRALQRYADGYPDRKTGQCTHISTTYKVTAARVIIVHPSLDRPHTTMARN